MTNFGLNKVLYFESSPPWHQFVIVSDIIWRYTWYIYMVYMYIWYIYGKYFWHSILAFYVTSILTSYLAFFLASILTFSLAFYLAFYLTFNSGILSCNLSSILSDIPVCHSIWYLHILDIPFFHSIWHSFWHLVWRSFWHSFWHSIWRSILAFHVWQCPHLELAVKARHCPLRSGTGH